jgi:hypothetical protein
MFEHFDTPTQSPPLTLSRMHANHNCKHKNTTNKYTRPSRQSMNILVFKSWTAKVADFGVFREQHATFLSTQSVGGCVACRGADTATDCDFFFFFIAPVLAPLL